MIWGQTPDLAENHCFGLFWVILGHFGHIRPKGPFWAILGQYGSNMAQNGLKWPIWLIWASKGRKPGFRAPDPKMAENHCFGQNDHFGSFWPYPAKRPFWASEAQYGQNRPFWPIFGLFGLYPAPEAQIGPNRPFIGKIGHL